MLLALAALAAPVEISVERGLCDDWRVTATHPGDRVIHLTVDGVGELAGPSPHDGL